LSFAHSLKRTVILCCFRFYSIPPILSAKMRIFDIICFIFTVIGTCSTFFCLRLLLPCCVVQYVNNRLKQTEDRLKEGEAVNAIPRESEIPRERGYRDRFARCEKVSSLPSKTHSLLTDRSLSYTFSQVRLASNHSPGFIGQVQLVFLCRTCQLWALYRRVGALQRDVEVRTIARLTGPPQLKGLLRWR
jgi:hypothetical protein